jgi:hypothetical protein
VTALRTAKPVPAWLNIDVLNFTNDDIDKIEALTADLRALIPTALELGPRITEVMALRHKLSFALDGVDDTWELLGGLFGFDVLDDMLFATAYLLAHPDGDPTDEAARKIAGELETQFPGITAAVEQRLISNGGEVAQ